MPGDDTSFIAVGFPSAAAAEDALSTVRGLELPTRDAAVVLRTDAGRVELQQAHELAAGESLVGGGSLGLVAGVLLGLPIGGALLGLAAGLVYGIRDRGLPDSRMRQLGRDLQPGQAVLCVLVDDAVVARAREALSPYGTVFDVKLSVESADAAPGSAGAAPGSAGAAPGSPDGDSGSEP